MTECAVMFVHKERKKKKWKIDEFYLHYKNESSLADKMLSQIGARNVSLRWNERGL